MDSKAIPISGGRNLPQSVPDAAGVYYLLDRYQKPLYIGKAGNIKKRILTHDYAENGVLSRHGEWIRFLKWELTGNNVIASLLEDHRIRSYWPPLNRAQKSKPLKFAVEYYVDRQERWRMSVVSKKSYRTNSIHFHSYPDAISHVSEKVRKWNLNGKLCSVPFNHDIDTQEHQGQFINMVNDEKSHITYDLFYGKGRAQGEHTFVLLSNGIYQGFGFIPENESRNPHMIQRNLVECLSSPTTEKTVKHLIEKKGIDFSFTGIELSNVIQTMKALPIERRGSLCIPFNENTPSATL
ncbi:MAG: nucleotide excision repair endonuclease [Bacteroidota bacterium]|jgi:DNA polymerase-3 subunit epsilon